MSRKQKRFQAIQDLVVSREIGDQKELLALLATVGFELNQATLSRDLAELMIAKVRGCYKLPQINLLTNSPYKILALNVAGQNLLVLKTMPGQASALALEIDRLGDNQILGTIAGDDNIFVATAHEKGQRQVITQLVKKFAA